MRLLVTGSRSWNDRYAIASHLDDLVAAARDRGDSVLVIHGDAQGVDRIARDIARERKSQGFPIDEHAMPAKWDRCAHDCPPEHHLVRGRVRRYWCPTAGLRRNAEMVRLGADLALAFLRDCGDEACPRRRGPIGPHPSHGAAHCADLAEAAGIPTVRVTWDQRDKAVGS